ncbi:Ig-like domain-containing protein [Pseudomonas sp. zjy_13]|uniref:Ig-like domain-containing protein n=1 Tax=Pseudomonas sp. zjy_13 TaxID=3367263 RepID=UPI00370C2885
MLQYKFKDATDTERNVSASSGYVNPKSSFTVLVSAGLDRKVKLELRKLSGVSVSTIIGNVVGSADKIEVSGKTYYGSALTINKPQDGEYELVATTLSTSGTVVSTETQRLTFDTVAPSFGEWSWKFPYGRGVAPDGLPIFSITEAEHLSLGVKDISDVSKASFKTFEHTDDGEKKQVASGALSVATVGSTLMLGTGVMNSVTASMIPKTQGRYSIQFTAEDRAGNEASNTLDFWNNSVCGATPEPVAIFDSEYTGEGFMGVAGFKSIVGATSTPVKANPARVMFKIPNREVKSTPEGAIFGGEAVNAQEYTVVKTEGGYTYFIIKESISETGYMNWNIVGWTNESIYRCSPFKVVNPVISPEALPPVPGLVQPYIEGYGWLPTSFRAEADKFGRDLFITKMRALVEPRPYAQVAYWSIGTCVVNPGEDQCIMEKKVTFNATGTVGKYHTRPYVYKESDKEMKVYSVSPMVWTWDAEDPVIEKLEEHDSLNKTVVFTASEFHAGANVGAVKMASGGLLAKNSSGETVKLTGKMVTTDTLSTFTTSYNSLKSGVWDIYGWADDNYKNHAEKLLFSIDNDGEKPTVKIETSNSKISNLDQISVSVSDDKTDKPKITEVKLEGGPSSGTVYLAVVEKSKNLYSLEYPVIFPSSGSAYKLSVTAQDDSGNSTTSTFSFQYEPPTTGLVEEGFSLPSVGKFAWSHSDGSLPFTSKQLTDAEGNALGGSYALTGTLRSDSTSGPITINGIVLNPGETKDLGTFNFTQTKGQLALPVFAEKAGSSGTANLLITSGAPGASIVVGSFKVWSPKVVVNPSKTMLNGRVLLDVFSIGLTEETGNCEWHPKSDLESISSVDIIKSPACFNTALENGLEYYEGKDYSTVHSRLAQVATTSIPAGAFKGAKIKGTYLSSSGIKQQIVIDLPVETSALTLNSRDASDAIKFGDDNSTISVYRSIQSVDQSLVQTSGPTCSSITGSEEDAIASGLKMSPQKGISSVSCFFKWTSTPPGMDAKDNEQQGFSISGTISELGVFPIAWELVAYTPLGKTVPVVLSRQAMSVEVVNPPPPAIEIQSSRAISADLFTVQKKPTNIGVVNIIGQADGAVVYKVLRAGTVIADTSDKADYAKKTATYRLNSDTQAKLWAGQSYSLQASYVKLPEIVGTREIKTVTVPDDDMSMKVTTDVNKALSSDTIPVSVGFYNKSNVNTAYSVEDAGEWSVRLVDVKSAKNRLPLSSWVPVSSDGTATIDLPLGMNAGDMMHIGSEGVLASKLDGFEMSKTSANTMTLTVLDASPVEGDLKSYKVTGVAPLSVSTSIVSTQKNLISEVQWQISHNNGASWTPIEGAPTVASKMLSNTYDAGVHQVRAKLKNRYSGVESYSSTLEIQAFHVPDARLIDGPAVMLVGQSGEKHVTNREGTPLSDSDNVVFEWSTDRGETWVKKTNKFLFDQTSEIGNYPLWARMRYATSPAEDSYAYKIVKTMVSVRKTAKVTVGLTGTTQPEVNKSNIYTATVKLPYSNMQGKLVGRFTLPDGSTVDGFTLDYRPTEVPTGSQVISFDAWIDGYEADSKRSVSKKLRAWEYAWPVFSLRQIQDPSSYAPTSLDLRVENLGSLNRIEGLTYAWDLPESDTFISTPSRLDTRRVAKVTEPGTYPVKVTVTDDRGNITVLEENLVIAEAPPWIIDMAWTGSNPNNRAVLDIRTKPQITRGHKYDSITGYTYKVNGVEAGTSTRYTNLSLTEPGRYVLSLDLTTELGFGGYGSTIIDVVENKKPECSLDVKQTSTAYVVTSKCTDPDGKMASYEWLINGELQSIRGSSISISKRTYPSQPQIQLTGIDDSGGRSEPISW